jgi:DNA-binding NarL/FixJ family response regulator
VHDIVAHNIAVMIALADGAAYTAEASPGQAAPVMGQVSATGRSALTEMRRLVGVLREPTAPGHARQPGLDDIEATRRIVASASASTTRVLILTTFDLDEYAYAGLRAGASGFLLKDVPPNDLLVLAEAAVKTHVGRMLSKLDLRDRV